MTATADSGSASPHPPFEAYSGDEPFLFVSYSHRDSALVYPELEALWREGYRIWYDEGIDPGNEWPEEIARALEACALFLVMISPRAVDSANVRKEINFALNRQKPFLAVHLEETRLPPGLELRISDIQAILRWKMPAEMYARKLRKVFPASLRDPARAPAAPPADPRPRFSGATSVDIPPTRMFVTDQEARALLGVTPFQLQELCAAGRLRTFRDGPRVMFKQDAVRELARELAGNGILLTPEAASDLELTLGDSGDSDLNLSPTALDDIDLLALDDEPPAAPGSPPGKP